MTSTQTAAAPTILYFTCTERRWHYDAAADHMHRGTCGRKHSRYADAAAHCTSTRQVLAVTDENQP